VQRQWQVIRRTPAKPAAAARTHKTTGIISSIQTWGQVYGFIVALSLVCKICTDWVSCLRSHMHTHAWLHTLYYRQAATLAQK